MHEGLDDCHDCYKHPRTVQHGHPFPAFLQSTRRLQQEPGMYEYSEHIKLYV